jgi:hypothetical protein
MTPYDSMLLRKDVVREEAGKYIKLNTRKRGQRK